jgi:hypothetical protein
MGPVSCKTVVVGTVYPGVEKFLPDYERSLRGQTCDEFDLMLANDGFGDVGDRFWNIGANRNVINGNGTIAMTRRALINRALADGYEKIIFTDCDDAFADDRIEVVANLLDSNPAVVNDLDLTNVAGEIFRAEYFASRFDEACLLDERSIRGGNMLGLSNTAARCEIFTSTPALVVGEPLAFDWYLWASVLREGRQAIFTTQTTTRYRIYDSNIAGMPQPLDERNIRRGIEVKYRHYQLMRQVVPLYEETYREFESLRSRWQDAAWRARYIDALQASALDVHMWWENIRGPTEVGLA